MNRYAEQSLCYDLDVVTPPEGQEIKSSVPSRLHPHPTPGPSGVIVLVSPLQVWGLGKVTVSWSSTSVSAG